MKTIIEMAREAGLHRTQHSLMSNPVKHRFSYDGYEENLELFAELVRADEREACAAQLDFNAQAASNGGDEYIAALLWQEAEEIRARGNT